jgi:GNAT superfamily N-acetyltransferase
VPGECGTHEAAVAFQEQRALLDVAEQKRDHPIGLLGHRPILCLGSSKVNDGISRRARGHTRRRGTQTRPMSRWTLGPERSEEAVAALVRAFAPNDPLRAYLVPDPAERRRLTELTLRRSVDAGMAEGRVDAWGDPIVGVAIWLPRPAVDEQDLEASGGESPYDEFGPTVVERVRRVREVVQRLRVLARPDRHMYLDEIGVVPDHQRHGIAGALLEAGHRWADDLELPCALEAMTDANVAFYQGRGYAVIASERVPESELTITTLRRHS